MPDYDHDVFASGAMTEKVRAINIFGDGDVSAIICKRICDMWLMSVPLRRMVNKVNHFMPDDKRLILADIYGIASCKIQDGTIKQRNFPPNELTVAKFKEVYKAWQSGVPATVLIDRYGQFGTETFVRSVLTDINRRYSEDKRAAKAKLNEVDINIIRTRLFGCARLQTIEGREAVVMYLDEMTEDMRRKTLRSLRKLPANDITQPKLKHTLTVEEMEALLTPQKDVITDKEWQEADNKDQREPGEILDDMMSEIEGEDAEDALSERAKHINDTES